MQEGGRYRFTMPQQPGVHERPSPPGSPKDSDLHFEVQRAESRAGRRRDDAAAVLQPQPR